jgi:hypothetical protein
MARPDSTARYELGVELEDVIVLDESSSPLRAVRLRWVRPGSPAAGAGLRPGDVVISANDRPTSTYSILQGAVASSGGILRLGVIRAGAGRRATLPPIQLEGDLPDEPSGQGLRAVSVSLALPRRDHEAPTTQAPSKSLPAAIAPTTPLDSRSGLPTPVAPAKAMPAPAAPSAAIPLPTPPPTGADIAPPPPPTSATPSIPSFPWPPPRYSSSTVVPDRLIHKPGTDESLYDVAQRLENGFRRAGYGQLSYYAVPQGFAMATRLEQIANDGTPLPVPQRWSRDIAPPASFSLMTYLRALFGANPGHFRVIVLVVTSESVAPDTTKVPITREIAELWPTEGATRLPATYKAIRYVDDIYSCSALIYEFEQGSPDDAPLLRNPGLDAQIQLDKADILKGLDQ